MSQAFLDMGLGQLSPDLTKLRLPGSTYSPRGGLALLRELLANQHGVRWEQLRITTGASMALTSSLCLLQKGAKVSVPRPYFPAYPAICNNLGLVPSLYDIEEDDPRPDPQSHAVIVNTPGNPLGNTYDALTLKRFARDTADRGALLLLDLVYRPFERHPPALPRGPHVLHIYSLGKELGIPGERLGYVIGETTLLDRIDGIHWAFAMGPPSTGMIAASMLLKEGVSYREGVFQSAQAARLALIEFPELETRKGEGIFQWIRVPGAISSDWLAQQCADQGIRVMPASAFGSNDVAVRASVALGSHTYASFQRLGRVLSRLGTHQRITK